MIFKFPCDCETHLKGNSFECESCEKFGRKI